MKKLGHVFGYLTFVSFCLQANATMPTHSTNKPQGHQDTGGVAESCPRSLITAITSSDKVGYWSNWLFGHTTDKDCGTVTKDKTIKDSRQLESVFSSMPNVSMGVPPDHISKCIDNWADGQYEQKGRYGESHGMVKYHNDITEDERKAVVEGWYEGMDRLTFQAKANIETIAEYDRLQDKPILKTEGGQFAYDSMLPGTKDWAQKITDKCKAYDHSAKNTNHNDAFESQVMSIITAQRNIKRGNEGIAAIHAKCPQSPSMEGDTMVENCSAEQLAKIDQIKAAIEYQYEQAPWLRGEAFKNIGTEGNVPKIRRALDKQIDINRKATYGKQAELLLAAKHLNGIEAGCVGIYCAEIGGETIAKDTAAIPARLRIGYVNDEKDHSDAQKTKQEAAFHLDRADCRINQRQNVDDINGPATQMAIAIGTAGIGTYISAARTSYLVGRGLLSSVTAMRAAVALNTISNSYFAITGIQSTLETCSDAANGKHNISGKNFNQVNGKGRTDLSQVSCDSSETAGLQAEAVSSAKGCMMSGAMNLALGVGLTAAGDIAMIKGLERPAEALRAAGVGESQISVLEKTAQAAGQEMKAANAAHVSTWGKTLGRNLGSSEKEATLSALETMAKVKPEILNGEQGALKNALVKLNEMSEGKLSAEKAAGLINAVGVDKDGTALAAAAKKSMDLVGTTITGGKFIKSVDDAASYTADHVNRLKSTQYAGLRSAKFFDSLSIDSQQTAMDMIDAGSKTGGVKHNPQTLANTFLKIDRNPVLAADEAAKSRARAVVKLLKPEKLANSVAADDHLNAIAKVAKFWDTENPEAIAKLMNEFNVDASKGLSSVMEDAQANLDKTIAEANAAAKGHPEKMAALAKNQNEMRATAIRNALKGKGLTQKEEDDAFDCILSQGVGLFTHL